MMWKVALPTPAPLICFITPDLRSSPQRPSTFKPRDRSLSAVREVQGMEISLAWFYCNILHTKFNCCSIAYAAQVETDRLGNQISALQEELKALKLATASGRAFGGMPDAQGQLLVGFEARRAWLDAPSSSQQTAHAGHPVAGRSGSRQLSNNLLSSFQSDSMSNLLLSPITSRQDSYAELPVSAAALDSYGPQHHQPSSSGRGVVGGAQQHVGNSAGGSSAATASTGQALRVLERVLAGRKVWEVSCQDQSASVEPGQS